MLLRQLLAQQGGVAAAVQIEMLQHQKRLSGSHPQADRQRHAQAPARIKCMQGLRFGLEQRQAVGVIGFDEIAARTVADAERLVAIAPVNRRQRRRAEGIAGCPRDGPGEGISQHGRRATDKQNAPRRARFVGRQANAPPALFGLGTMLEHLGNAGLARGASGFHALQILGP